MPNDDDRPATNRDLNDLRNDLRAEMGQLGNDLRAEMGQLGNDLRAEMHQIRDEMIEKMREMQTEVLRAFYDWSRPVASRLRNVDEINTRLGLLEERVTAIEKRNFGL